MNYQLAKPVFLIGFMGAGKSSVAAHLCRRCGIPCIEMDSAIEDQAGMPIARIFAEQGEAAFRDLESAKLCELAVGDPALVSCGGGVVERSQNRELMMQVGFVVYLETSFEQAQQRIGDDGTRPLFADADAAKRLFEARIPLYEQTADVCIDTDGQPSEAVAACVYEVLLEAGVLKWAI